MILQARVREFSDDLPECWTKNRISSKIKLLDFHTYVEHSAMSIICETMWTPEKSINNSEFTGNPTQWEQFYLTQQAVDQMLKVSFMLSAVRADFCPPLCSSFSPYTSVGFLSMRGFHFLHSGLIKISVKKHYSLPPPLKWIISDHHPCIRWTTVWNMRGLCGDDGNLRNCWLFLVGKMY